MAGITDSAVRVINSTYVLIRDTFRFLDNPGIYILWIILGLIYVPFLVRNIYNQYANPHGFYVIPMWRKAVLGSAFIAAWLLFGYANFLRFVPT